MARLRGDVRISRTPHTRSNKQKRKPYKNYSGMDVETGNRAKSNHWLEMHENIHFKKIYLKELSKNGNLAPFGSLFGEKWQNTSQLWRPYSRQRDNIFQFREKFLASHKQDMKICYSTTEDNYKHNRNDHYQHLLTGWPQKLEDEISGFPLGSF